MLTRIFVLVIGIYILIWGLWYPLGQDLFDYMIVTGLIYNAGAFSLLIFGIYWKRASKVGAYLSLICGFLALAGLKPVQNLIGINVRSDKIGLIIVLLNVGLMVAGSLLFPDKKSRFVDTSEAKAIEV